MRTSRLRFKYALRQCQNNDKIMRADALARSLYCKDSVSFWKGVRGVNCNNIPLTTIFKNRLFQTCIIVKRTCTSIFSKIGLVDQSKPCTQIYLQKIANCINLQLAIRILKNQAFRTCTTPYGHPGQF